MASVVSGGAGTALLEDLRRTGRRRLPRPRDAVSVRSEAGPIVKWVGGKSRLLPELVARAPTSFRRYHEPFVGGAALYFELAPRAATLSDVNAELIACYRAVQNDVEAV